MTALRDGLGLQAIGCPVVVTTEHGRILVLSWETGRLNRLLGNHPERELRVPDWALPDFDVIAGRAIPLPITPPKPPAPYAGTHAPMMPGDAQLEDVLRALGGAGCRPMPNGEGRWRSMCPLCLLRGRQDRRVLISYDRDRSRARVWCFGNCTPGEVLAALDLAPAWRGIPLEELR